MEHILKESHRSKKVYLSMAAQYSRRLEALPRKKYVAELLFRVPLMFAMYQWYLLSPYSEYRIIEAFLVILRLWGAYLMIGCTLLLSNGKLINIYASLFVDILIGWSVHLCYWMFQNVAYRECHIDAWMCFGDIDEFWWVLSVGTLLTQLMHFWNLHHTYGLRQEYGYEPIWIGLAALIPHALCTFGISPYFIAPIHYWVSKVIFCTCLFGKIIEQLPNDPVVEFAEVDALGNPFALVFFMRNLHALFGLLYFVLVIFIDGVFRVNIAQLASVIYITSYIGDWCTSFFIFMSLASMFSIVSNTVAAFSRYFVIGKTTLTNVFDNNIGNLTAISMAVLCVETGLLIVDREVRIENMKMVIVLTFYMIICQTWGMTDQHFLFAIKRAKIQKWKAYTCVRFIIFSVFIITLSSMATYYTSSWLHIDPWLLMHASGNFTLIVRAFLSLAEVYLVSAVRYNDDGLEWLENADHIRTVKSFITLVCIVLLSYYRLMFPFFDGLWLFRVTFSIIYVLYLCRVTLYTEWANLQKRRSVLRKVGTIPDASPEQIADMEYACSICHCKILSGKQLPCKHSFHEHCLRIRFMFKTVCPLCNATV